MHPGLNKLQERKLFPLPVPAWSPSRGAPMTSTWSTREKLLLTAPISGCAQLPKWEPTWEVIGLGNAFTSLEVPSAFASQMGTLPVLKWV